MDEATLLKQGWRTDFVWTNPLVYGSFLKLVPLFLDTRALMRSQYWSREKIEHLQDERLRALFRCAIRIPFWRDVFSAAYVNMSMAPREILSKLASNHAQLFQIYSCGGATKLKQA